MKGLSAIAAFAALTLAGCETVAETAQVELPATSLTVQQPEQVKYYRSDEPLKLGIEHFNRGSYGLAEQYFRDAVEKAPRDVTAWVGLAASYDRLARFDLADRPTPPPSGSPARPPTFSTIKVTPTCCAEISWPRGKNF